MKGYKQMSDMSRNRAFFMMKGMSKDGKLPHGAFTKVAKIFQTSRATIGRIWDRAGDARADPLVKSPAQLKLSKITGRPPKYDKANLRDSIRNVPL